MKNKIKFIALMLTAVFMFCGCRNNAREQTGATTPSVTTTSPKEAYSQLVGLLQDELSALKRAQSEDASEYEAKIKELEKKLEDKAKETTAKPVETTAPEPEMPILYEEKLGEITITGVKNGISVLVIPEKIDGKPVTSIADSAFAGTALTSVSVPSGVRVIGWFAFSGSVMLKSVTIPASVEVIGYDAFANCRHLTVHCPTGSYAEKYTASYGISCVTE